MHSWKSHEKIMTMHDFSLVTIPPGNLLGSSEAGTVLTCICNFIFCEDSASPAGGSKIHQASHPKLGGDDEQYVMHSAGKSSQKEDFPFISHFHWMRTYAEASTTGQCEIGEKGPRDGNSKITCYCGNTVTGDEIEATWGMRCSG